MAADPLDVALAKIRKDHGKGAIRRLGEEALADVEVISTGLIGLDEALGVGGLPRGRVIELFGPESSGKSSLALRAVALAQKAGGVGAYIDAEHALDTEWAQTLGVDTDALLVSQPDWGEQALAIAEDRVKSGRVGIIVIDSVAALAPKAELDGEMGASHVGLQARMMSQALRKLTAVAAPDPEKNWPGTTILFINQLREKIGVFFGNAETQPGGKALKFYSSVRMDIRRIQTLKDGTDAIGNRVRVKVVKNKCARPFQVAEFDLYYGEGISREAELVDLGATRGVLRKSGAFYSYGGDQLGQGREKTRLALCEQPDLANAIEQAVRDKGSGSGSGRLAAGDGAVSSENGDEDSPLDS
jgi:recombination protein RecA